MKSLRDATADQLGGTSARNRLNDLVKAGNFGGNSGVAQLNNASSIEERFRAIGSLIDQANAKGSGSPRSMSPRRSWAPMSPTTSPRIPTISIG